MDWRTVGNIADIIGIASAGLGLFTFIFAKSIKKDLNEKQNKQHFLSNKDNLISSIVNLKNDINQFNKKLYLDKSLDVMVRLKTRYTFWERETLSDIKYIIKLINLQLDKSPENKKYTRKFLFSELLTKLIARLEREAEKL